MKRIQRETVTVAQANEILGVDMEPAFWEALVRIIAYPELEYAAGAQEISFPNYIPFQELAREWIEGIEQGIHDIRLCEICAVYFDVDQTDGIFGNAEELTEFICAPCADRMTAREYYDRFATRHPQI